MNSTTPNMIYIERLAVQLFAFMKQAGLKVNFQKQDSLTFVYHIADMTEDAQGIGLTFVLDLPFLAKFEVDESEESMEKITYAITLDMGCQLFKMKCSRLLQFDEKRKILLPNEGLAPQI
jgi:hypothetical protein